jgi:hypothetical protein
MTEGAGLLGEAIAAQRRHLTAYEKPAEPIVLETARALDHVFCRDLFPERNDDGDLPIGEAAIMSEGGNQAFARILPRQLSTGPFRMFPSTAQTRAQADTFLFHCGVLAIAERQAALLREGLLSCHVDKVDPALAREFGAEHILVLDATSPSAYAEAIGRRGQRWAGTEIVKRDRALERALGQRHRRMLPALAANAYVMEKYYLGCSPTREMVEHFTAWAELYLKRMPHQDMIGREEPIGGRKFGDYVAALTVLSGRSQMQLCFAGLLKDRFPGLVFRNLLTRVSAFPDLLEETAEALGSTTIEAQRLLSHLTLDPHTGSGHLERTDTAWAPVIRTSERFCVLPVFGLDINPFLYLVNDLRVRYPDDWFRLANTRERRWLAELETLFPTARWTTNARNLKLKRDGRAVTDIDFAVQDSSTGDLALFQLKWQQPTLSDPAVRRSNAANLLSQCNSWIEKVREWIRENGLPELTARLGFPKRNPQQVHLFVLARYGAHFTDHGGQRGEAVWSDWTHFRKVRQSKPHLSLPALATQVAKEIAMARSKVRLEQTMLPLPGLAVAVNPIRSEKRHIRPRGS